MREIKFRGMKDDTSDPKLLYGSLVVREDSFGTVYSIEYRTGDYIYAQNSVIKNTIGQYTGLKDRTGKEIYEGDIVIEIVAGECSPPKVVNWSGELGSCGCCYMEFCGSGFALPGLPKDVEVLGNIYENPELTNPTKDDKKAQ